MPLESTALIRLSPQASSAAFSFSRVRARARLDQPVDQGEPRVDVVVFENGFGLRDVQSQVVGGRAVGRRHDLGEPGIRCQQGRGELCAMCGDASRTSVPRRLVLDGSAASGIGSCGGKGSRPWSSSDCVSLAPGRIMQPEHSMVCGRIPSTRNGVRLVENPAGRGLFS